MSAFTETKTLLGHKGLAFSIECLTSFVDNAAEKIWLIILGDGSLTGDDIEQIQAALPNSTVIDKAACDELVLKKLASYPACLRYRKNNVFAHKLFDLMLYDSKDLLYIDSDIFFLKKFSLPEFANIPVFMQDYQNAYSFTPLEFIKIRFFIYKRLNSGFFFFPKEQFDLDYIELLLQNKMINKGYLRRSHWFEQTIWSFLASRYKALNYFNPKEIVMATEALHIDEQAVCIHLVTPFRNHFAKEKAYTRASPVPSTATAIQIVAAGRPLRTHWFYAERVLKGLRRYLKQA